MSPVRDPVSQVEMSPNAFEAAAIPFLPDVSRFARSLTRETDAADDLVQETYLRALRGWHTFRPGSNVRHWLFAICRNAFLESRRREHRLRESSLGDDDALPAAQAHARAVAAGHEHRLDQLDLGPAIATAVTDLPEPHHSIVVLVDMLDHSYEEAAAILGVPVGTVRSRLFRARRMVQEALLAYAQDAGLANGRSTAGGRN